MNDTNRVYKRTKYSVPFTFTAEESHQTPHVAPAIPSADKEKKESGKYEGVIQNISYDGFCFEAEHSIEPGTEIAAEIQKERAFTMGASGYSECKATVKWCSKEDGGLKKSFRIGVKRVRENDLPIMNFRTNGFGSVKTF